MNRKGFPRAALLAGLAAILLVAWWLPSPLTPAWARNDRAGPSTPSVVLPDTQRDLGTVSQGAVLRTSFRVENAGSRRLILIEEAEGCCGQSAQPRQITVPPRGSKELTIEVDTARWSGEMEHRVRYSTNDPKLPRFTLTVSATVRSPPPP